jgi:hypothetical protein
VRPFLLVSHQSSEHLSVRLSNREIGRKGRSPVTSPRWLQKKSTRIWMGSGLAALAATQLYYVRELLAALLLFSIGFIAIAAVILILFLLDRGINRAMEWTSPHTAHAAQLVRRGWVQVEQFGRKQFQRFEQPVER